MFTVAFLALLASPVFAYNPLGSLNHTCAITPRIYSCENTTSIVDTCCSPVQGLVLTTQFWSIYTGLESSGQVLPKSSWSVHGLWPDRCDGSYGQYCDLQRQYDPVPSPNTTTGTASGTPVPVWTGGDISTPTLRNFARFDLLAWMNKYWIAQGTANWIFWQHEFSKHATCFSTYDVGNNGTNNCYGVGFQEGSDIVDFYESVAQAQLQYPTYQWLQNAGITPSNSTTYKLADIQAALVKGSGAIPYLGCSGANKTVLSEVWYYAHSLGKPQQGFFKNINQTGNSSCNATAGISYYTRASGSEV